LGAEAHRISRVAGTQPANSGNKMKQGPRQI
jgi:hypothetical protein